MTDAVQVVRVMLQQNNSKALLPFLVDEETDALAKVMAVVDAAVVSERDRLAYLASIPEQVEGEDWEMGDPKLWRAAQASQRVYAAAVAALGEGA